MVHSGSITEEEGIGLTESLMEYERGGSAQVPGRCSEKGDYVEAVFRENACL